MKKGKTRIPIQRYWTTRYLVTLVAGLSVIAILSAFWIRHTTLDHRLNMMEFMSREIADRFVENEQGLPAKGDEAGKLPNRKQLMDIEGDPLMYIVDVYGNVLSSNREPHSYEADLPLALLEKKSTVQKVHTKTNAGTIYVVKAPIKWHNDATVGWVLMVETKANLTKIQHEYRQLAFMITGLALLGWAAVYFLSRRLTNPIKKVAKAARQVQEGNYNVSLPEDMREEEVYELVSSFKEMSQQLQKLEGLRTELLAGVTHELKTPVTSISGLLQALNDKVVSGEEAEEFLEICLKETAKMKNMVEDLLAFNSFAANAVPVHLETYEVKQIITDFVHEWQITNGSSAIQIKTVFDQLMENSLVQTDLLRLNQILTNLMNNAVHAMGSEGEICIETASIEDDIQIAIRDTGHGIPEDEQKWIFEQFFRGESKKYKIGGLGLGLPFSKMIAHALNGDLQLLESTPAGTIFRITLPRVTEKKQSKQK